MVTRDGELSEPLYVSDTLRESPAWKGGDTIVFGESDERGGPVDLKEIPVDGSAPAHTILPAEDYWVSQADWSESGLLFVRATLFREPGDVWLLDPDGGVTQYSTDGGVIAVSWSPDGRSAVYTTGSDLDSDDQTLWVQFENEKPRALMTGALGAPSWGSR
jgi:Tol biopolymer transport system component